MPRRHSGIVHQDVEPAKMPNGFFDGLSDLIEPGHAHLQRQCATSHCFDFTGQAGTRVAVAKTEGHVRACICERQ